VVKTEEDSPDVKEISGVIPNAYSLQQNYPNPFQLQLQLLSIPEAGIANLSAYNLLGEKVMKF
jgi:hypothetical protein